MSEPRYQVAWPYLTVKILDASTGSTTVVGYTEGGILPPTADPDDVKRLVAKGALRKLSAAENQQPAAEPKAAPAPVEPSQPAESPRPTANASKADWVTYAVSQRAEGVSEDVARAEAEAMSRSALAGKYGNGN